MKRSLFVAIVCMVALIAVFLLTRKKESDLEKSVEFKLVKTFGAETEPKEAMLSGVYGLEMDEKNNIYFMDRAGRLVSFAADGSFRWQVNRKGKGPGDIQSPRGLTIDGVKYLYLSNLNGTRFDKFDLDGNFINSFNVGDTKNEQLNIIGFVKSGLLIAGKILRDGIGWEIFVLETDNNFRIRNQFRIDKKEELNMSKVGGLAFEIGVYDDKIITGSVTVYRLCFYDLEGNEIKYIEKDVKNLIMAFSDGNSRGIAGEITVPLKINGNYYLAFTRQPTNITEAKEIMDPKIKLEYETTIDIFNKEGSEVCSKKNPGEVNPEIGWPIYSDSEGYLYTFKEMPYPQICKYQVIISDKK